MDTQEIEHPHFCLGLPSLPHLMAHCSGGGHPKVPPLDDYTERGLPLQSQPQDVGFDVPNYAHALKTWTAYKILTPSPPPSSSFILPSILLCPLLSFPWQIQTSLPRFPL